MCSFSQSVLCVSSVIMISIISCILVFASCSASSSTVRFHPLGVLSNGMTLRVFILYANARSDPKQTHCPCGVVGLSAIKGLFTCACRDSIVVSLLSASLDTSKRPSYHTTDLPSSNVLRLPRSNGICILVLLDALLAPLSCTLPCRFQM